MAKQLNLTRLSSGFRSSNKLNENFEAIQEALDNTLSRDGSTPNQMTAPIDMNSQRLINLPAPTELTDPIRLMDVDGAELVIQDAVEALATANEALDAATTAAAGLTTKTDISVTRAPRMVSAFETFSLVEIAAATATYPNYGGDPSTVMSLPDVSAKIQALADSCAATGNRMVIPKGRYRFNSSILSRADVAIDCDPAAEFYFTNPASSGWVVEGVAGANGYADVKFPRMIGPNNFAGYYLGSPGARLYNPEAYVGVAVTYKDCIWMRGSFSYAIGWRTANLMVADDFVCDNLDLNLGCIDICREGIVFQSFGVWPCGQSRVKSLNVLAKFPVIFRNPPDGGGNPTTGIFEIHVDAVGLASTNIGGACVYIEGPSNTNCSVTGRMQCRHLPDSDSATPSTYKGPIISGGYVLADGGNWAQATNFRLNALTISPDLYDATNSMAFRLFGAGSKASLVCPEIGSAASLTLSTSGAEAAFNGGYPAMHKYTYTNWSVTSLAPGAVATFYFFHQRLNPSDTRPIGIDGIMNDLAGLTVRVERDPSTLRRAIVRVKNETAAPVTNAVNMWLRVD